MSVIDHLPLLPKCRNCDIVFIGPKALRLFWQHIDEFHTGLGHGVSSLHVSDSVEEGKWQKS